MARAYTRPELTSQDLKEFQRASCVAINPARTDLAGLLTRAEKGCSKRLLALPEILASFDEFTQSNAHSVFLGHHTCNRRAKFPLQCTVFQLVRLTDSIVGLICDRQQVLPGNCSKPPIIVGEDGVFGGRTPVRRLQEVLSYFWSYLSDTDIDAMHQQCTTHVMSTLVPLRREQELHRAEIRRQRRANIEELFRGVKPEFTTAFAHSCQSIARDLKKNGQADIAWSTVKKQYPAYAARYKSFFLGFLQQKRISAESLESASTPTEFDCRVTTWRGACRIFDAPQLVIQIRNIPIHWRFFNANKAHKELSRLIKAEAMRSPHPATENTVGWLRVHVDDNNKLCFVDEVQSDAIELALAYSRKAGYEKAAGDFLTECSHWHLHAFATVCQWADNIGYRAAIHSRESAEGMEFMTRSERKWATYYGSIIKQFGLCKAAVSGYREPISISNQIVDP